MTDIIAIVQARMGSSRLPGKMLRPLAGRPLVDHVLARLATVLHPHGPLDGLVLATSDSPIDDPLATHVRRTWPSVELIRGSENDVLGRFMVVLNAVPATTVIRVTGDCPLINVANLEHMIEAHQAAGADVTNYRPGFEYMDKGVEVVSASALRRAAVDPQATLQDREHVTALMYRRPGRYRVHYIDSEVYLRRGDIRLTVDTEADLPFLEALCQGLGKSPVHIGLREVVEYLNRHPALLAINATAGRKSTLHERARLGFRCDGGPAIGLGHVVSCLRLARLVARELGIGVEFVVREDATAVTLIQQAGFAVEVLPTDTSPDQDIARLVAKAAESDWSGVVIHICKDDIDRYAPVFQGIKDADVKLIFMDNPVPPSYRLGDLVINALPHPDYPGYDPASHPACYDGLAYFLLDGAFEQYRYRTRKVCPAVERVLVAMGGADPENTTGLVLDGLATADYRGYVDVVLGAANPHEHAVRERFAHLGLTGEINHGVRDMTARMWAADLGFSALGLTTYEMASMGLPTLIVPGSAFNATVAELYCAQYEVALIVGKCNEITSFEIADAFGALCQDLERRRAMSARGRAVVGGKASEVPTLVKQMIDDQLTRTSVSVREI